MRWLVLVVVVGCGSGPKAPANGLIANRRTTMRLFDRLGGRTGIHAIVDAWVREITLDDGINAYFANADVPHLREALTDQLCQLAGGPCRYKGKDMRTAHDGMGLRAVDFAAIIEDLDKALAGRGVDASDRRALHDLLAPIENDVVAPL